MSISDIEIPNAKNLRINENILGEDEDLFQDEENYNNEKKDEIKISTKSLKKDETKISTKSFKKEEKYSENIVSDENVNENNRNEKESIISQEILEDILLDSRMKQSKMTQKNQRYSSLLQKKEILQISRKRLSLDEKIKIA